MADRKFGIITNMGAANPLAAANVVAAIANRMGITLKIAAVTGDDVLNKIDPAQPAMETNKPLHDSGKLVSANAYLGIEGILEALQKDADIIITGRVADPSLFLAPMVYEFGWDTNDYALMGKGTVIGHLLECAGQVTGGYFADGIEKFVEGLDTLGHPLAEITPDGSAVITKVVGTGGVVNLSTAKEQLLYEVINPYQYFTPDVIADFSLVTLLQTGDNRVQVNGGDGKEKPASYKVSVGYQAFYLGEGEISYAGHGAMQRAKLAAEILHKRIGQQFPDLRFDYIGSSSLHHTDFGNENEPYEIRLRISAKAETPKQAAMIGEEVEALYTNGPAGGGGVRKNVQDIIGVVSTLIDRVKVLPLVTIINT